ncbi:MAG: hypothetical protein ACO3BG_03460 [Candidatus Nanopelagicales bacterium]|jgi:hypothetical protein
MLTNLVLLLAETPEIDPDRVRPGVLGLLTFGLLAISVTLISYFLIRSLKKTDQTFKK